MKKHQEQGNVVEVVIIVVLVLAVVGLVVWRFMDTGKKADEDTAKQTTSETANTENAQPDATSASNEGYVVIEDWSVKIPLSSSLKDLSYTHKKGYTLFTSTTLASFCSSENGESNQVIVQRGKAEDAVLTETGGNSTSIREYLEGNPGALYIKVGDYYFIQPAFRGASCAMTSEDMTVESRSYQAIVEALGKMVQR